MRVEVLDLILSLFMSACVCVCTFVLGYFTRPSSSLAGNACKLELFIISKETVHAGSEFTVEYQYAVSHYLAMSFTYRVIPTI